MNILNITSIDSTAVTVQNEKHHVDKTNDDVIAFSSVNKTTLYFPRGLEKFFKNLQAIYLEHGRLQEVHQRDFSPYSDLKALYLGNNDIQVLEDGLFDFNVNLEFVSFWGSKIIHIDEGAFKNLQKLSHLWLNYNNCSTKWVSDDLEEVKVLIKELGVTCSDIEYSQISASLKNLEKKLKTLSHENYQEFSDKFKIFGKNFQNSNFSTFLTFKERFEGITNDPNYRESNDYLKLKNKIETVKFSHKSTKANCENVCLADVNKFAEDVVDTLKSTFTSFSALSQKVSNFGRKMTNSNLKIENDLKKIEDLQNEVELIGHNLKMIENSTNLRYFEDVETTPSPSNLNTPDTTQSPTQTEPPTPRTQQNQESKTIKLQSESNLNQTRKNNQKKQKPCESKPCSAEDDNNFKIEVKKNIEDLKNDTKIFEDKMIEKVEDLTKKVNDLTDKNEQLSKSNEELTEKVKELIKENEKWKVDNEYFTFKIGKYDKELEFIKKSLDDLSQKQ